MKKFLLSETVEVFLYLTTAVGMLMCLMLGMMSAPGNILEPLGITTMLLMVVCLYYGTWRGMQRSKGL